MLSDEFKKVVHIRITKRLDLMESLGDMLSRECGEQLLFFRAVCERGKNFNGLSQGQFRVSLSFWNPWRSVGVGRADWNALGWLG